MSKYTTWNARGSALGGYAGCTMRAWLDNGLMTGRLDPAEWGFTHKDDVKGKTSPPADFGTCAHWHSQTSMRCQFMPEDDWNNMTYTGWDEDICWAAKYTDEQWVNGASMFSDIDTAFDTMTTIAKNVRENMPRQGEVEWMAESCFEIPGLLNGHLDFLSNDWLDIVDLKTTSTKPPNGRPHPGHVHQLVGYALGVYHATGTLPERGWVLYAHSRGDWVSRSKPIEFHSPILMRMLSQLTKRLKLYADFDALSEIAYPSFGSPCNDYCPYTHCCRDAAIPHGVPIRDKPLLPLDSPSPFA